MKKESLFDYTSAPYPVIDEENYPDTMNTQVLPLVDSLRQPFQVGGSDGITLYGETFCPEGSEKTVVIVHGFTESCDKYREMIYYFLKEGFSVCIYEQRGHGRSRGNLPLDATHVRRFQHYVDDLNAVISQVVKKQLPSPYYLFAHSMGGLVGGLYLEQHPNVFTKAVFNSPMFEVNRGGMSFSTAWRLTTLMCLQGKGPTRMPGQGTFSEKEDFPNSAATSYHRYRFYHQHQIKNKHLQHNGASIQWLREGLIGGRKLVDPKRCAKVTIPVLLFQAEHDTYVLPGGQDKFMASIPNGTLLTVPGSKHEIYLTENPTFQYYVQTVMDFLR